MRRFFIAVFIVFFFIILTAHAEDSMPSTDFDCSENKIKIEIKKKGSNFLFTTTGLSTAATAQYYLTSCITTVTSSASDGIFSIVSAPYLREEIVQGGGEHLDAWFQLLGIPMENQENTLIFLKNKYPTFNTTDDLVFAQKIHKIVYDFNQIPLQNRLILNRERSKS